MLPLKVVTFQGNKQPHLNINIPYICVTVLVRLIQLEFWANDYQAKSNNQSSPTC